MRPENELECNALLVAGALLTIQGTRQMAEQINEDEARTRDTNRSGEENHVWSSWPRVELDDRSDNSSPASHDHTRIRSRKTQPAGSTSQLETSNSERVPRLAFSWPVATNEWKHSPSLFGDTRSPLLQEKLFDLGAAEVEMCLGAYLIQFATQLEKQGLQSRGPYGAIAQSRDMFDLSMKWKGDRYRHIYRIAPRTFRHIVSLLEQNPIFKSTGSRPQRSVKHQLACFLIRYGASDSYEPVHKTAIGRGTVFLYCRRVTRALRELGLEFVAWPDEARKQEISAAIEEKCGIPGCIGIMDNTLIPLARKPSVQGDQYWCRKGWVAVNVLGIVDHELRFIAFETGWPGCKADTSIWRDSFVWKHRGALIARGEHLLADGGYFISPYICLPYKKTEMGTAEERPRRKSFNKKVSRSRVWVEHAFGKLKKKFPSLRFMGTSADIQDTYRAIEALMVLHNICIDLCDEPTNRSNYPQWQPHAHMPVITQHSQPLRHTLNTNIDQTLNHVDPEPQHYMPPIVPSQANREFPAWRNQELQVPQYHHDFANRVRSPSWSVSPPGTPAPSIPSRSSSVKLARQSIPPQPVQADDNSEPELPEASQLLRGIVGPNLADAPATNQIKSNEETALDQGRRPWTNDEIGAIIAGVTDPDHPENYELTKAKGFNDRVAERWSKFSEEFLKGQRSGRATWSKFKDIKDTYREVRELHMQTGNGGLLQLEDTDSKAETMQKLGMRLKKLEGQVGKLKHVTNKEVYYSWVKGGQSSWFACMHARYGDDMALQRPVERSSGRLSPLIQIEATDDDKDSWESRDTAPQRRQSTTPDAQSPTPDAPSTPSSVSQPLTRGKKRKLGARFGSEVPEGSESTSSKTNKLLDRVIDALPPSIPPSIHERRLALDEKKLEMEDKRADKNTSILEKRLELEIKQLEAESKRRQRRWDIEDEDRKRRQAEDDSTRGALQGRANIEFLLKLAKPTAEGGTDNEAIRKHAESAAIALVEALTRQSIDALSKRQDTRSLNADVDMDGNPEEVQNNQ